MHLLESIEHSSASSGEVFIMWSPDSINFVCFSYGWATVLKFGC